MVLVDKNVEISIYSHPEFCGRCQSKEEMEEDSDFVMPMRNEKEGCNDEKQLAGLQVLNQIK